jgi:hypothetical protein
MTARLKLEFQNLFTGSVHLVEGQEARCLLALHEAGAHGVTSLEISSWALRTSHYVYKLRKLGLAIDMEREKHGGVAPGHHGRYRLLTGIQILSEVREAA